MCWIGAEKALEKTAMHTFLIRPSSDPGCLTISKREAKEIIHIKVMPVEDEGGWTLDAGMWSNHELGGMTFDSLESLLAKMQELKVCTSKRVEV